MPTISDVSLCRQAQGGVHCNSRLARPEGDCPSGRCGLGNAAKWHFVPQHDVDVIDCASQCHMGGCMDPIRVCKYMSHGPDNTGATGSTKKICLDRPVATLDPDAYQGAGISL